jgi:putative membrane-bound dehydrogenase-like protein
VTGLAGRRLLWAASAAATVLCGALSVSAAESPDLSKDAPPRSLDPRLKIELFAEQSQIVTPTDLAVDYRGRVWAIESNTHFRPAGYKGHPTDRILVFTPKPGGGRAGDPQVFADGFTHAMSIAVPYGDGVYVATRREVLHLVDKDGDGKPDERRSILKLETKGDYPHNGLAGFAFDGLGYMYLGLGENLGANYRLVGTDGRAISGGGEGGSLFRFKPDGTDLSLWATGFWNPHASCVDAFGNMFTVDNDPDDRPPCRLLHIIPGGDYGFRFRNGRRGIHPFTAWDGELPGTLPMVCGTGEAPSGIIAYESDTFPEEYRGSLLASSWGDHRLDRFRPKPKGTSFTAKLEPIIVGGENFRPVGVALAPDGTVYITDWVLKDYNVHGKGRIWRILPTQLQPKPVEDLEEIDQLPYHVSVEIIKKLNSPRMDIRRQAARHMNPSQFPPNWHVHAEKMKRPEGPDYDKLISSRGWFELWWAWFRGDRLNHLGRALPLRSTLLDAAWPDFDRMQDGDVLANPPHEKNESPVSRLKHPRAENPSCPLVFLAESPWGNDPTWLSTALAGGDPFVFTTVVQGLTSVPGADLAQLIRPERTPAIPVRLAALLAARRSIAPGVAESVLPIALKDPDPRVRFTAIQWVGEGRLAQFRGDIERELSNPKTTADLFEASLASLEMLDGVTRKPRNEFSGADYALRLAGDPHAADAVRAMALRIVPLDHKGLTFERLAGLMKEGGPQLRFEALRTFRNLPFPAGPKIERDLALDEHADKNARLEAIAGLALALERDEHDAATIAALRHLLTGPDPDLACEALRALRRSARNPDVQADLDGLSARLEAHPAQDQIQIMADQVAAALRAAGVNVPTRLAALMTPRPQNVDDWIRLAAEGGDPAAGRRLFDFPNSVACYRCHTVHGRGGKIGPDLSLIARAADRRKLAESILRPAKEIAPQFATWSFVTRGGKTLTGVLVSEDREGHVRIGGADGQITEIQASDVEERVPQKTSIMPERLTDQLTAAEFRDLVAFLASLK